MNSSEKSNNPILNNCAPLRTMAGKPQVFRKAKTVLSMNADKFKEKKLCDGMTLNLADSCGFNCSYCYVEAVIQKVTYKDIKSYNDNRAADDPIRGHRDLVIRRENALELLRSQLLRKDGKPRYCDINDKSVVFSSTLVDVAANLELLKETARACNLIFDLTNWQIRLLSKSSLLYLLVAKGFIPERYHHRLVLGFSVGTLDDRLASAIECGTSLVSKRLEALHWLQDKGFRTFGMLCPSLPQTDYDQFSREICAAIRIEKCEDVWAEVINVRGQSLVRTVSGLRKHGFESEAVSLESTMTNKESWENYSRATFVAHAKNIPKEKLHYLQYVNSRNLEWWKSREVEGAVLLGKILNKPQVELAHM